MQRVVAYADGWMPNRGADLPRIPELQELARAAGRGSIPVTTCPKAEAEAIEQAAEAGVERCIWYVSPDGRDQALAKLEELGELIRPFTA